MEKKCTDCLQTKPAEEFYKNEAYRDGRMSKCKSCQCRRVRLNQNGFSTRVKNRSYRRAEEEELDFE